MRQYRIKTPDGKTLLVDGPEGATEEELIAFARSQVAGTGYENSPVVNLDRLAATGLAVPASARQMPDSAAQQLALGFTPRPGDSIRAADLPWRDDIASTLSQLAGRFGFNERDANQATRSALGWGDYVPFVGEAAGVADVADSVQRGNYAQALLQAGATAVGAIPFGGDAAAAGLKAMFLGVTAKNADRAALARAESMAAQGADRDAIWKDTGWFKGVDQKWRFEIDDSKSYDDVDGAVEDYRAAGKTPYEVEMPLAGVFGHDELYKNYPDLEAGAKFRLMREGGLGGNMRAGYQPSTDTVFLADQIDSRSSIAHEVQHAIQDREGFARGGNGETTVKNPLDAVQAEKIRMYQAGVTKQVDDWYNGPDGWRKGKSYADFPREIATPEVLQYLDLDRQIRAIQEEGVTGYRRLAGEVEARNVQKRLPMNTEQRRAWPPWVTQDVADTGQNVRF